jgi:hypothetical protein
MKDCINCSQVENGSIIHVREHYEGSRCVACHRLITNWFDYDTSKFKKIKRYIKYKLL